MSNIPADLQRLWAEHDRNISLDELNDTSPLLFIRDEEFEEAPPRQQPLPVRSLMQEISPIPTTKIFPVYSLKPQTIPLGTYHGRTPGNP